MEKRVENTQYHETIATMAELVASKKVTSNNVHKSLEFICQRFRFEAGLLYDINQYGQFNLQEKYLLVDLPTVESFVANDIAPRYREHLAHAQLTFANKAQACSPFEEALLTFFQAESVVIFSIVDENWRICGLIVFVNAAITDMTAEQQQTMKTAISILGNYASVRTYQKKLSFARVSLERILDNMGIDIYVNDFSNHDILYVNKSMAAPYGGAEEFVGQKCWAALFPGQQGPCEFCPQLKLIDEHGNPTKVYSWDYQRQFDGSWFRVFSAAFGWADGRLAHVVSSVDITENKRNEELISYMANYDDLTRLPNRRMFLGECERRITNAQEGEKGYILFFDIDGFKAINDNLGHEAGDEFLVKLGQFFSNIPMLKHSIYRNGGDEFVAIFGGVSVNKGDIRTLGRFIHERFKNSWELGSGNVFCNTSIGVACYPEDGLTADALIAKADQAMYHAKKQGGGKLYFAYELLANLD